MSGYSDPEADLPRSPRNPEEPDLTDEEVAAIYESAQQEDTPDWTDPEVN